MPSRFYVVNVCFLLDSCCSPTLTLFGFFASDTHIKKTLSHFLSYLIYSKEIKLHFYKPVLPQMIAEDLLKKLIPDLLP